MITRACNEQHEQSRNTREKVRRSWRGSNLPTVIVIYRRSLGYGLLRNRRRRRRIFAWKIDEKTSDRTGGRRPACATTRWDDAMVRDRSYAVARWHLPFISHHVRGNLAAGTGGNGPQDKLNASAWMEYGPWNMADASRVKSCVG